MLRRPVNFFRIVLLIVIVGLLQCAGPEKPFQLEETTIAEIHAAMQAGNLTSRQLVEAYLKRIEAYDQSSGLNAIVVVNPRALERADALDEEFHRTGKLRPLHGIPMIVKDNYDTHDLQTSGGSIALKGSLPPDDATQVRAIREAGAIVLAKSNMAEWAFSPYVTESSIAGVTRNPYDLERVPAGSSGGTGASVSANFGVAGLGTDTGNSIRGPSSHNCLVGIRSTMGLTSRDGIIPLNLRNDVGGPMARTVEDAARIFGVIAGFDPADPITEMSRGKIPETYTAFLDKKGLVGVRVGVFRTYIETETTDPEIKRLMEKAIVDLASAGAEIVDPFDILNFDELRKNQWCNTFQYDVNQYLASLRAGAPFKTIRQIYDAELYDPSVKQRIKRALNEPRPPEKQDPPRFDVYRDARSKALREAVLSAMDEQDVDVIVFPTWSNQPRKVGDMESPAGDNSQILSPQTGLPAMTVPMGFVNNQLPAGLQMVGKLFGESDLIRYAYAYEQATKHRRPPVNFPPLSESQ